MTAIMMLAMLAALPLALMRLGIDIGMLNDSTAGFTSSARVVASLIVGLPYLLGVGAITDEQWEERTLDRFRSAQTVCDHFNFTMAEYPSRVLMKVSATERDRVVKDNLSVTYQALERLSSTLRASRTSPAPKSSRARSVRRSYENALKGYLSAAMLANIQLTDSLKSAEHVGLGVMSEQHATARIAKQQARILSRVMLAREGMATTEAYFRGQAVATSAWGSHEATSFSPGK